MKSSDWIALVQALLLAAGAVFAWRGYRLASTEHREARDEAKKAPLRELVADVVRELKALAAQAEEVLPGVGTKRDDLTRGHQQRLAIALRFVPPDVFNLFSTQALTTCPPQDVTPAKVADASTELLRLFAEIEDGRYSIRHLALPGHPRPKRRPSQPLS